MSQGLTPYTLTQAEGELIELVNGAAETNFVFSMGLHPETGWTLRFSDGVTGQERQVSGASFREAWTALRRGPRGFQTVKGGKH